MQSNIDDTIKRVIDVNNSISLIVFENKRASYVDTSRIPEDLLKAFKKEKADESANLGRSEEVNSYSVIWQIYITATSYKHAANVARKLQLDKESTCTRFEIRKAHDVHAVTIKL